MRTPQPPSETDLVVFHVDADAFFAACHVAHDPSLAERPLVVAGNPAERRGVVLAASYRARPFGVQSGMPLARALALCPSLLVLPPDRALYRRVSRDLHALFARYSPLVEPFSIDEAWLDMRGGLDPFGGDPVRAADALRAEVRSILGITVSVGISTNRHLAKQASALGKPDRTTVLRPEDVPIRLWPLPAEALFGCGPRTAQRLRAAGIATIGDIARAGPERLQELLGAAHAQDLVRRARGEDTTGVETGAGRVFGSGTHEHSLSAERTLARDVAGLEEAEPVLLALADEVAQRLRQEGLTAGTVTLKYRTRRFATHTMQRRLSCPTQLREDLYQAARRLFAERPDREPVRLLGVGASALVHGGMQLTVDGSARRLKLARAEDALRARFGPDAIRPARLVHANHPAPPVRPERSSDPPRR